MQTQNIIDLKAGKHKSGYIKKLSITQSHKHFTVYAVAFKGTFIPLKTGTLQQVIEDAEFQSAHLGVPIEHDLNERVEINVNTYKSVGGVWAWIGCSTISYRDLNEAYLQLRKIAGVCGKLELTTESASVRKVFRCSRLCNTLKWEIILYRLKRQGEIPEHWNVPTGHCVCCFSKFVKLREEGTVQLCLNCGHEQTRN